MATMTTHRNIDVALQRAVLPPGSMPRELVEPFVRAFLRRIDERYLLSRTPESLLARFTGLLAFIADQPGDAIKVRVFNPTEASEGYSLEHTVIETSMPDQPFILDTVRLLFRNRDIREYECLHPIIEMHRDASGGLIEVGAPETGSNHRLKASVMHIEVERIESPVALEELRQAVLDRLQTSQTVVQDFHPLVAQVKEITEGLQKPSSSDRPEEAGEASTFLNWLLQDNFVFMGYEAFRPVGTDPAGGLESVAGSQLGLRRLPGVPSTGSFPEIAVPWLEGTRVLFFGKDDTESKVHRAGKIDTVLVRCLDAAGRLESVHLVSGLLTYKGVSQEGSTIPILRGRLRDVLRLEEALPGSHYYKSIITAFNSIPVEYLFGADVERIRQAIQLIISAENRQDTAVSIRIEPSRRSAFVLISMPRQHYDEELREEISQGLLESLGATYHDHRLVIGELQNVVLELYLTAPAGLKTVDVAALEARILQLARPWNERFQTVLAAQHVGEELEGLVERYSEAFPEAYTLTTPPEEAVRDVQNLEALRTTGAYQFRVSRDGEDPTGTIFKLKIYERTNIFLTDSLPILDNFGLRVIDQSATRLQLDDEIMYIDTFRVAGVRGRTDVDLQTRAMDLADGLRAVLAQQMDDDALNRLLLTGDLTWRQLDVLRAYIAYARQLDSTPLDFIRRVWLSHPKAARLLIEYFEVKFDPAVEDGDEGSERTTLVELRRERLITYLKTVESAAEDRGLRTLMLLVDGTVRTNYFRTPTRTFISFKLDSYAVHPGQTGLRPFREIFVHHHSVEGIHLRGGPIARGGLRWSDRYDDYRTEVLDLMRTQMVKNVLIVPVGAKGGFILKQQSPTRELERAQADEMYKIFIRGLLDVTDNIVQGQVVRPAQVVAYEGDDPYLVVAADKGTAHLSDTANAISLEYGFWLGDAFASGGSKGYDHKVEAITAKGAWECVKRHFRELGVNPEQEIFTCIGIGDMSGDVFGNGMLLSRTMKLTAAFNHMHIFLDPDPDPARSFEERHRLFELPRSTWEDYRRDVISAGGGIFRRNAKAIVLTPEVQALLGATEGVLTGDELVRRILVLPADLLWNGGIGTYVKASAETHADVGDRVNDGVRIDGRDLRVKIVGEGGNLGFTQAGRVEFARIGGRLNTDAVDNSGGVDMSDHEVNLKILFQPLVASGQLEPVARDELLRSMTNAVAASVLSHNYTQSMMISLDELRSQASLEPFIPLMEDLEQSIGLNRAAERLPDARTLADREKRGEGLYRPELAKLGPYTKMRVQGWLLKEPRLQGEFLDQVLASYFPIEVRDTFGDAIKQHPLRREILTTVMANRIIDAAGITFFQELYEETGRTAPEIAMAYFVSSAILDAARLKQAIYAQDNLIPAAAQYRALIDLESALEAHSRRTLRRYNVFEPMPLIQRLRTAFQDLHLTLVEVLPDRARDALIQALAEYQALGIPDNLARELAAFPKLSSGSDIVLLHEESGIELPIIAWLYHAVGEETRVRAAFELARSEQGMSRWDKSALAVLRGKLIDLQYHITLKVARLGGPTDTAEERLNRFIEARQPIVARIRALHQRVVQSRSSGVAPVSVLAEVIQELLP